MRRKLRIKQLTPEQKKIVWAASNTNAGAGWKSDNEPDRPAPYKDQRK